MLGKTPASIEVIKPLRDGVIADLDSTKEMISYFHTENIRKWAVQARGNDMRTYRGIT